MSADETINGQLTLPIPDPTPTEQVTAHCSECGRWAQLDLTPFGPSLCLVCAGMDEFPTNPGGIP